MSFQTHVVRAAGMPIPKATVAVVDAEKIRDYLLNLEHPEGKSKAACFQSPGCTRSQ